MNPNHSFWLFVYCFRARRVKFSEELKTIGSELQMFKVNLSFHAICFANIPGHIFYHSMITVGKSTQLVAGNQHGY